MTALHTFTATRVLQRLRGGSSSPIVVATEGGRFVTKLRGSGQGVLSLVAEIIVAEIAEQLGLAVPERVLIELPPDVPSDDKNDELADLLRFSIGTNLGLRWLDGARDPRPEELRGLSDELAARVLFLDELVMNHDRTPANPNILFWRRQPWLIDHGAALPFHHHWSLVTQETPSEPMDLSGHLFAERLSLLDRFRGPLAGSLSREIIEHATASVPDAFLLAVGSESAFRSRAAYQAFLWLRLKALRGA